MKADIRSKTSRAKLEARREPYWSRIQVGLYVGFRTFRSGEGTWIARRQEEGRQKYFALGHKDDYDSAVKAVLGWASESAQGVAKFDATVEEVCKSYVEHQRLHKSTAAAKDAETRFARLVYGQRIGKILLIKLTTTDVKAWLNALVVADNGEDDAGRRSKDTANRHLNVLKAALNMALRDRLVATDAGWKTVTPFRDVGRRREAMLSKAERNRLIEACDPDLRLLLIGLSLTASRPGELAAARVADFDNRAGAIALTGKTGRRIATLSTEARNFFAEQSKGKLPSAFIFARADGLQWGKDAWKKPFKAARAKAGLSSDTVVYTLRHTAISDLIANGIDVFLVARLAGTSTAMIDRHYGHLRHDRTRAMLDAVRSA